MRRIVIALTLFAAIAVLTVPASAKKRHNHKPSGVACVVLDSTCPGACAQPAPPEPLYSGDVTITVARASDGGQVASEVVSDGHFRLRLKRGTYDVSSVPPNPPPCEPTPETVCPLDRARSAVVVRPCLQGETKRVVVRRHHFSRVELHVGNVCVL